MAPGWCARRIRITITEAPGGRRRVPLPPTLLLLNYVNLGQLFRKMVFKKKKTTKHPSSFLISVREAKTNKSHTEPLPAPLDTDKEVAAAAMCVCVCVCIRLVNNLIKSMLYCEREQSQCVFFFLFQLA